ncbi:type II toxin-antitoxin system HipA family toxin [Horticoccus sp. 23ND18S-11]|uniref:type II toxin-antitoxin system HipA family toxin n=1 Tax=Horticoccus sp. 23ND18S-11 TaxID=3391832 RepID=UPI0039C9DF4F
MSALGLWMNGQRAATWSYTRGSHELRYEPSWLESPDGRALSLSLPFTPDNVSHRGDVVENFFDNLLPDSDRIRSRLRTRFGTRSTEAFELLTAIGRDCVGAIQLLPPDQSPTGWDRIEAESLTEQEAERAIDAMLTGGRTLGQEEDADFRISIAGAQEKIAFLYHRKRWCRPLGATPTTHILKLPLGKIGALQMDMQDSVENEWLCLKLMQAFGLEAAACEIVQFGARKALAVERFDRKMQKGKWIARLPQEDFCQTLGLPSTKKYESDGGPGMRDILRVLDAGTQPMEDKRAFVKAQILFWLLAATDGHAKNFSLFLESGGTHRMTPFYDVLSAWPIMGRGANKLDPHKAKLAMAVRSKNVHWKLQDIQPRHWDAVTRMAGLGDATPLLHEIAAATPAAIQTVSRQLPPDFPAVVRDRIFEALLREAPQLVM